MVSTILAVADEAVQLLAEADSDESGSPWFGLLFVFVPLGLIAAWLFRRRHDVEELPRRQGPPAETTEFLDETNRPSTWPASGATSPSPWP